MNAAAVATMPGSESVSQQEIDGGLLDRDADAAVEIANDSLGRYLVPTCRQMFTLFLRKNLETRNIKAKHDMFSKLNGKYDGEEIHCSYGLNTLKKNAQGFEVQMIWDWGSGMRIHGVPEGMMEAAFNGVGRVLHTFLKNSGAQVYISERDVIHKDANSNKNTIYCVFFEDFWITIELRAHIYYYYQGKACKECNFNVFGTVKSYTEDTLYNAKRGLKYEKLDTLDFDPQWKWRCIHFDNDTEERREAVAHSLHEKLTPDLLRYFALEYDIRPEYSDISLKELKGLMNEYRKDIETSIKAERGAGGTVPRMHHSQDAWDEPANPLLQRQQFCCMKCGKFLVC